MKYIYQGTPFSIETSKIENKPVTWNSTKVQVYDNRHWDFESNCWETYE